MSTARVSRPASVVSQSMVVQERMMSSLPDIAHPASRLGNPNDIHISGNPGNGTAPATDRSLVRSSNEVPFRVSKSAVPTPRLGSAVGVTLPPISAGAPVVTSNGKRPSIPVLGQKSDVIPRVDSAGSHFSVSSSVPDYQSKLKLEIDELEGAVRKKVNENFYQVRSAFVTADIDGVGSIGRDQCHRVLMTVMGRTISLKHFNHLLARVGLGEKSIIGYSQFYTAFREKDSSEPPPIFDTQFKHFAQDKSLLTANQAAAILKEKTRKKVLELGDVIPNFQISDDPNDKGRVMKPELWAALQRHGLFMTEAEFNKLWAKFDSQNLGVVESSVIAKKLGIHLDKPEPTEEVVEGGSSKKKIRIGSEVERVLKGKLHASHLKVRDAFAALDEESCGKLSLDNMQKALKSLEIEITGQTLLEMLARFEMENSKHSLVPYDEFLQKVQDHKEEAILPKFISGIKDNPLSESVTDVEKKLKQLFQPHLQHLMEAFDKADRLHLLRLTPEEFRSVLQAELGIDISDEDLSTLLERLPLDEDNNVLYVKFLEQFNLRSVSEIPEEDYSGLDNEDAWADFEKGRSVDELVRQIKMAMGDHFFDMEHWYKTNVDYNTDTGRLTQTQLYKMLNTFMVPEITHGEIRSLWKTFHLNIHKTLDYQMFLRHFLYNKKTAAYPNQRVNPPQIGDADLIRRSNKVNSCRDVVYNMLHRKIDVFWDQIKNEMKYLDPHSTGFVSYQQFKNVLTELQVELDDFELQFLCEKFDTKRDNRVNYNALLEPFAGRTQHSNMVQIFNEKDAAPEDSDLVVNKMTEMTERLRDRLIGDVKNLRKAFRKLDDDKSGYLSISEFRSVLEMCNVVLDEEESFQLAARYDDKLNGKMKYDTFLKDLQKTPQYLKDKPLVTL